MYFVFSIQVGRNLKVIWTLFGIIVESTTKRTVIFIRHPFAWRGSPRNVSKIILFHINNLTNLMIKELQLRSANIIELRIMLQTCKRVLAFNAASFLHQKEIKSNKLKRDFKGFQAEINLLLERVLWRKVEETKELKRESY